EDAESLEQIAADIRALMAGDAAVGLEQLIAAPLLRTDGIALAGEPAIERRARRQQGTLEGGEAGQAERWRRRRALGRGELVLVRLIGLQLRNQRLPARAHQPRIEQDGFGLLLQRAEIAAPIEPEAQRCVEDRGRIEVEGSAIAADRPDPTIVPAQVEPM